MSYNLNRYARKTFRSRTLAVKFLDQLYPKARITSPFLHDWYVLGDYGPVARVFKESTHKWVATYDKHYIKGGLVCPSLNAERLQLGQPEAVNTSPVTESQEEVFDYELR